MSRMTRLLGALIVPASLVACAQVQKEHVARSVGSVQAQAGDSTGPAAILAVSGKLNKDFSSEYFGYFDLTLENKSDEWLVVSKVNVTFVDSFQNEHIRFISGPKFTLWYQSMAKIIEIDEQNQKTAMATIAALGAGVAAFSGNRNAQALGAAAAVGAGGAYLASEHGKRLDSLQNTRMYPENHLLGDSIVLPPGLFADRWLLVNSSRHEEMEYVTALEIELEMADGRKEKHVLEFRPQRSTSFPKWQREVFERKGHLIRQQTSTY